MAGSAAGRARLLIAEDAPTTLGIRLALNGLVDICAEARSTDEAIAAAAQHRPQLCLIGLRIPGSGYEAVRAISSMLPQAAIVVLADAPDPSDLLDSMRAGAIGYLPKAGGGTSLRRAVRAALDGEAVVPRCMVGELVCELQVAGSPDGRLSARESQVLGMLRRGHRTERIARQLGISPITVRRHISAIMRKTGARDRGDLIVQGSQRNRRFGMAELSPQSDRAGAERDRRTDGIGVRERVPSSAANASTTRLIS